MRTILRTTWLLIGLKARIFRNRISAGFRKRSKAGAAQTNVAQVNVAQVNVAQTTAKRTGTARKRKGGAVLLAFAGVGMLFSYVLISFGILEAIDQELGTRPGDPRPALVELLRHDRLEEISDALDTTDVELGELEPFLAELDLRIESMPYIVSDGDLAVLDAEQLAWWEDSQQKKAVLEGLRRNARSQTKLRALRPSVLAGRNSLQDRVALAPAPGSTVAAPVASALSALLFLLGMCCLSLNLGQWLAETTWDLEWLASLPVPTPSLLASRILERTFFNVTGLFVFLPMLVTMAWRVGDYRWAAVPVALALTLCATMVTASVGTILETWIRLRASAGRRKNIQAALGLVGILLMFAVLGMGTASTDNGAGRAVVRALGSFPRWTASLPWGWPVGAFASTSPEAALLFAGAAALATAVVMWDALLIGRRLLARGVVSGGAQDAAPRRKVARTGRTGWLSPVARNELRLLFRDRSILVQTLIMPPVIIGLQLLLNPSAIDWALRSSWNLGVVAFGLAAYAHLSSSFVTLAKDQQGLWLLYTVPSRIARIVMERARFWTAVSLIVPLALFGVGVYSGGLLDGLSAASTALASLALAAIGSALYGLVAASLGVFALDPFETNPQRRIKVSYVYLYMLCAGLYANVFLAPGAWAKAVTCMFSVLLTYALWQKAKDHLPYLLDPTASPPARLSLADGLIATQVFFVLQTIVVVVWATGTGAVGPEAQVAAFAIAGFVTAVGAGVSFWRRKAAGWPRFLGTRHLRSIALGALLGALGGAFALLYLGLLPKLGLVDADALAALRPDPTHAAWLLALGVGLAPVVEEPIFRGLVMGGLRRSLGVWPAIFGSAALFAACHPPISVLPVFGLGLLTAWSYQRTGALLAPVVVHAVYNGVVLGAQLSP